jgi:hypothetical protein
MIERRMEVRTRLDIPGVILADEHRTMACIVSDRSATGIRVTSPDVEELPDTFILTLDGSGEAFVCRVAWRTADQVGCIADVLAHAWFAPSSPRRQSVWA